MLEDKHAQRILAPQCALTVGMCCLLPFPFLTPVTQIRFNFSSQRWGQPKAQQTRDVGPVLAWCLHCLLLLGPRDLAEDKNQTLLELAALECAMHGPWLWDSVVCTGGSARAGIALLRGSMYTGA